MLEVWAYGLGILSAMLLGLIGVFYADHKKASLWLFFFGVLFADIAVCLFWLHKINSPSSLPANTVATSSAPAKIETPNNSATPTPAIIPESQPNISHMSRQEPPSTAIKPEEKQPASRSITNSPIVNSPNSVQNLGDNVTINQAPPPRLITQQQKAVIRAGLQAFKGQSLVVITTAEKETQAYAIQIGNAIGSAGLKVEVQTIGSILPPPYGVTYYADASNPPALLAPLLSTFRQIGIEIKRAPHLNAVPEAAHAPNALVAIQVGHRE